MQIISILSGVSARLMGLLGLVAAAVLAFMAYAQGTEDLPLLAAMVTGCLFCVVKALQFLTPSAFQTTLAQTEGTFPRIAFTLVSLIWLLISGFVILEFGRQSGVAPPIARALLGAVSVTLFLFMVFILMGLSYRAFEAQAEAEPNEPEVEYYTGKSMRSVFTSDAPAPRMMAKRYETFADANPYGLRRRDLWDYLAMLLLATGLFGGIAALRFSDTVLTAGLAELIADQRVLVYAAITLIFAAPMVLVSILRRPATRGMARMGLLRRFLRLVFAAPLLGAVMMLLVAYQLAPYAWNVATTSEAQTLRYTVVEVESTGLLRDCVRLALPGDSGHTALTCGLANIAPQLAPGTVLEATGELSLYAHTLSNVTLVPG